MANELQLEEDIVVADEEVIYEMCFMAYLI